MRERLKEIRAFHGLTYREAAEIAGVGATTYLKIEKGKQRKDTEPYQKVKAKLVDTQSYIRRHSLKKHREMSERRIPNIPNFYERLERVCDENGNVCVSLNEKELHSLRVDLGVIEGEETKVDALGERKNFATLLKEFRGNVPQTEHSRRLGVTNSSYHGIESEKRGARSRVMQGMLTNNHFTKAQQRQLTNVYNRMRKKEMETNE